MKLLKFLIVMLFFLTLSATCGLAGGNNNTPDDAFGCYQDALRSEDINLLVQVYHFPDAERMSASRLMKELKTLKRYDGYRNYTVTQVIEDDGVAKVKVKGTLGGRENVRRTFQLKRFSTGWKITRVWNY